MPFRCQQLEDPRERAFAQELCYGVLRWLPRFELAQKQLLDRPLKKRDLDLKCLLHTGMYQLDYLGTPEHAAVSASVDAARELGKTWASGLINAVLRRYLAERDRLKARIESDPVARDAHPAWLRAKIEHDWPTDVAAILAANNRQPPLTLRVNRNYCRRGEYRERLRAAGIEARDLAYAPDALVLETQVPVEALPDFAAGAVTVQDAAAQLAAPLLDLAPGQRVLDACAAPGVKTTHILELQPRIAELVAVEKHGDRCRLLRQTLKRLGQHATVLAADAADTTFWWDGAAFDRILLDAPCSGIGVIRRHPDIKWRRTAAAITAVCREQRRLLAGLWPLLKSTGKLLYVTCSILAEENDAQIAWFISNRRDARLLPINAPWGRPTRCGRQILPGEEGMDGFYYACLEKR